MLKYLLPALVLCVSLTAGEDQQVNERLQDLSKAINEDNVQLLPTFLAPNATLTTLETGKTLQGNEFIQFLQSRAKEIKERKLHINFTSGKIEFPGQDRAIVSGIQEITDKDGLIMRSARRLNLVKTNGQWYIASVKEIEVEPAPPLYQYLKEIEWLVGNWKDTDDNVDITFNTKWDKFKNFIVQHFKMSVYGTDAMEGMQIIGWDPIEKKIRSWVYDSDGGYGTGYWTKLGDSWSSQMNFVLSDGEKGSATNIYTKIDDKSYKYSSINRSINGEALPNIDPVTIVKTE